MGKFLELANTAWLGTAIGLCSIAVAIYFYVQSKRIKRISYVLSESSLAGGANSLFPDQLKIVFDGIVVPRVTGTRLIIWNSGTETISGTHIASSDPFRIIFPENSQILQATIIKQSRAVIDAQCKISNNDVLIEFDFLDRLDGFNLEIIHSSMRSTNKIYGTIRGLPNGFNKIGNDHEPAINILMSAARTRPAFRNILLLFGASLTLLGVFYDQLAIMSPTFFDISAASPKWTIIFIGIIYLSASVLHIVLGRKAYPKYLGFAPTEVSQQSETKEVQKKIPQ